MADRKQTREFERKILPHLDAAFNLARWITRSDQDAEDVVQESCLRALAAFEGLRGVDARPWLLAIVRNASFTWLRQHRARERDAISFDEELHSGADSGTSPERITDLNIGREMLNRALEELPEDFREAIVLRELESCSYKEIAQITGVPVGTVMSRLARARAQLSRILANSGKGSKS